MEIGSGVGIQPDSGQWDLRKCFLGLLEKKLPQPSVGLSEGTIPLLLDGVLENTRFKIPSAICAAKRIASLRMKPTPRRGSALNKTGMELASRGRFKF